MGNDDDNDNQKNGHYHSHYDADHTRQLPTTFLQNLNNKNNQKGTCKTTNH